MSSTALLEPRGFEAMVGAILTEPHSEDCIAGVISSGSHKIDTPVGIVTIHLNEDDSISVDNVPSYRYRSEVAVEVPDHSIVTGDIAWGGNWFFLINNQDPEISPANIASLRKGALEKTME